jgi:ornithine decarboxylase
MHDTADVPTPVLVVELPKIVAAYREMKDALGDVDIHYAMKCNPHPQILRRLHESGCGFEVASANEIDTLVELGVDPAEVLYSNPVKPMAHIARAYRAGVRRYSFDSHGELVKLAEAAPGSSVYVRLATTAGRSGVPSEGKFGVDGDQAHELMLAARNLGLRPYGIGFHVGSQMMSPLAWQPALETVAEVMEKLAAEGVQIEMVNVGGGFPAHYATSPPAMSEYAAVIRRGIALLPYPVRAVAEPGRALVAEAGTLVGTVIGTALRGRRHWVHLDVGAFNGLMESLETNNRLRYPVGDSRNSAERRLCNLTGPTCDSQDTILFDVELSADLTAGDQVRIGVAGA